MFGNHTMSVVLDLNILGPAINDVDFMAIAAVTTDENYPHLRNIYNAGVLVPPTELLMEWADDPTPANVILAHEYPMYLQTTDCDDMIVALIAALTKKNVVLYIPKDEFEIYGNILLQHIYYRYGITCNFGPTPFSINQSCLPFIYSKFYMMNMLLPYDYLNLYPGNVLLPQFVINKLAEDLHPFNYPATFDQYAAYFNELNAAKCKPNKVNMVKIVEK